MQLLSQLGKVGSGGHLTSGFEGGKKRGKIEGKQKEKKSSMADCECHADRSRGVMTSEPRGTQPRLRISTYPPALSSLRQPGVAGSSPITLTTSLAMSILSSSSLNGPSNVATPCNSNLPGLSSVQF